MSLKVFVDGKDVSDAVTVTDVEFPTDLTVANGHKITFSWETVIGGTTSSLSASVVPTTSLSGKFGLKGVVPVSALNLKSDRRDVDHYIIDWMAEQIGKNGA